MLCLVLSLATSASAQSAGSGSIQGRVTDEKGGVVPSVKVTVRNVETNVSRELETDAQGDYRAVLLQPGLYEVTVSAPGFATLKRTGIRVEVGSTATANLEMRIAAVTEVITVTGEAPITEPEKVEVTSTVGQRQIDQLPLTGRRWDNFVLLTPGVSPDGTFGLISSRGISGLLNNNTVDGADNNQAFFSEPRGRTRTAYIYSQDAVKEFQVGLSTFSAESGRAAGGTLNAVTKSGSNEMHGDVFYYIRDDAIQAREPTLFVTAGTTTSPVKNKDRRQQYGLSLGMPFVKDKLFFFGNFDQQHRTETYLSAPSGTLFFSTFSTSCASGTPLPPAANCTALLNYFQSLNTQNPRKRINNVALGKLDWVINPRHNVTGSYNWHRWKSPSGIQTQQILNRSAEDNGLDGVKTDILLFRLNSVLNPRMVNQAQFQYGRDFEFQTPNSLDPRTTISNGISFGMSEFLPRPAWPDEKRFQWTDTFSWMVGRHTWKFGLDINYVRDKTTNIRNGGGQFDYTSVSALALDCPRGVTSCAPVADGTRTGKHWSTYTQAFDTRGQAGSLFFTTTDYNFFVQDTFKWRPTVTVNVGLRYEFQKMPEVSPINFAGQQILGYPQFPETQFINQDKNNLGPRLAIAWDIGGKQKSVLRAGGGIYYGRTPNAIIRSHLLENGVALPTFRLSSTDTAQLAAGPQYPGPILSSPPASTGARGVNFMAGDYVRPFIMMVDAAYEQEIARNISLSATYLFTRGNHLTHSADINLNPSTSTIDILFSPSGSTTITTDRFLLGTTAFYAGLRPLFDTLPGVAPGTRLGPVLRQQSDLNSLYHGLIFQFTQRARFGLTQVAHFTVSRARDEGQAMGASPFAGGFETFFDTADRKREYALSDFDVQKRLVWYFIWEPSQVWRPSSSWASHVLGDWSLNGVVTAQDGQPFQPNVSGRISSGTGATDTGSINGSNGSLRAGWLPRNPLTTTGFVTVDFRVQKDVRLNERMRVRFLWEAFNLLNRANHANRFNFSSTAYRVLTSTGTPTRQVVLRQDTNFVGVMNGVSGKADLALCTTANCLGSASGVLFGARDMQFGLKFIF
ncbi:MAG: carboxypeptidase regulatory-like domain-containing protein [Acidobacteria bacterium]|nr:carboxypeptidase regulatory-like domain-containing protein [Acidobacteriota bacterium]